MAVASSTLAGFKLGCAAMRDANPGRRLIEPDPKGQAFVTAVLSDLLVEQRSDSRRKRRPPRNRHRWLSLKRVRGGHEFLES